MKVAVVHNICPNCSRNGLTLSYIRPLGTRMDVPIQRCIFCSNKVYSDQANIIMKQRAPKLMMYETYEEACDALIREEK